MTPVALLDSPAAVPVVLASPLRMQPRSTVLDDANARRLLQRAQGSFQKWPEGFAGFRADVRCQKLRREAVGRVTTVPPVRIEVRLPDPDLAAVVEHLLRRLVRERTPRFFKDADGRFPLTMDPPDGHPLGCRIVVHEGDGRWHAYRVDSGGRLRAEERTLDGMLAVTTFEECGRGMPGRFLPCRTVTEFFDLETGALLRTATRVEGHVRVDHVWLPESHRLTVTGAGTSDTTLLEFSGHALV